MKALSVLKRYFPGALAASTYGMNPLFTLPLYSDGMDPDSVLFFRYCLAMPVLFLLLKIKGQSMKISLKELAALTVFGFTAAFSSLALFLSYNYMGAGIASSMLFVYPVFVALLMRLFFHEKPALITAVCILASLAGIALLYRNDRGDAISLTGTLLVLGSALAYAVFIVWVNKGILKNIPALKLNFYVLLFGMLLYIIRLNFGENLILPGRSVLWLNIASLVLFPTVMSFLCTTASVQLIGSVKTSILGALEPVTAVCIAVAVFGEKITLRNIAGLVLIIAAVILVALGDSVTDRLKKYHVSHRA